MKPNTLTSFERQLLINQLLVLRKLSEGYDQVELDFKIGILESGYTGLYHEVFSISEKEVPSENVEETIAILNMYRRIYYSTDSIDTSIQWEGFDGHDIHFSILYLMREAGRWQELENQVIDSHSAFSIIKYRRMLEVLNKFDKHPMKLTQEQLDQIIEAVKNNNA